MMNRPSSFALALALLVPAGALAQDAPAGDAPAESAPAESAPAGDGPSSSDPGTPADTTTADPADSTTTDPTDPVDTFVGTLGSVRVLHNAGADTYRATATVDGDDGAEIATVEVAFANPDETPTPSENPLVLVRTGTSFESTGSFVLTDDGSGAPTPDALYDLTLTVDDVEVPVLEGVRVGSSFTVAPGTRDVEAVDWDSISWSDAADCVNCPVLRLIDNLQINDPSLGLTPIYMVVTGTPVDPGATPWTAVFMSIASTATFESAGFGFDGDALGRSYTVLSGLYDDGSYLRADRSVSLLTVEPDTEVDPDPEPVPTWIIDGTIPGSVKVEDGDYVLLAGEVTKNVTIEEGGTLVLQGGTIGKSAKLEGGTLIVDGGTINGSITIKKGFATSALEVGDGTVGKDIKVKGALSMTGTDGGTLVLGRRLMGSTTQAVTVGGNLIVQGGVSLRAGDLVVNDTLSAEGDVDLRVRGDADGGLVVNGTLTAEGDVELRSKGAGGIVTEGPIDAGGDLIARVSNGDGGGLIINGGSTVSGKIELTSKIGAGPIVATNNAFGVSASIVHEGSGPILIHSDLFGPGNVILRTQGGGAIVVDGSIEADEEIEVVSGGDLEISGNLGSGNGFITLQGTAEQTISGDGVLRSLNLNPGAAAQANDLMDLSGFDVIEISGDVGSTNGNVTIDAVEDVTITGSVDAGGSIEIEGRQKQLISALLGAGVSYYSNTTDRSVVQNSTINVTGGSIVLHDNSELTLTDSNFSAGNGITLNTGGSIGISAGASLEAGVNLAASVDVDADFGFRILPGGVSVDAGTTTEINGTLTSVGDIEVNAGSSTTINGTVDASEGDVSVTSDAIGLWSFDDDAGQDTSGYMNAGGRLLFRGKTGSTGPGGERITFMSAGGDIDFEMDEYLQLSGQYSFGGGEFFLDLADLIILEFGGSALFDGTSGEFLIQE